MRRAVGWSSVALFLAGAVIASALWGGDALRWAGVRPHSDRTPTASSTAASSPPAVSARITSPITTTVVATASVDPQHSSASATASDGLLGLAQMAPAGTLPAATALRAKVAAVPRKNLGTTTGFVEDLTTGQTLYDVGGSRAMLPASTLKVLTTVAAVDELGAWRTFTTTVVQRGSTIVLVGGGDPYLASVRPKTPVAGAPQPATSAELAAQVATTLKAQKRTTVTLQYDDTLFTGPAWNPDWPAGYADQVTPVSALWIDKGRLTPTSGVSRTPALTAAQTFANQLKALGITVHGSPARTKAPASATRIAQVQSWPVGVIVQQVLLHSDNSGAEVLLRQLGRATGTGASFTGGAAAVRRHLTALGVWRAGMVIHDGSGLSRANRVPARALADAVRVAARHPELAILLEGLPVAGATGTLGSRFFTAAARPGRGVVHAKTGTLTHVSTFAGYLTTRDGRLLAFSFMANGPDPTLNPTATVGTNDWGMRVWLDSVAGTLAGCRCR